MCRKNSALCPNLLLGFISSLEALDCFNFSVSTMKYRLANFYNLRDLCFLQDDKFEKLFKLYAKKTELKPEDLTFCFDGDKVSPTTTPTELGLEDGDMIEVHVKPH